MPPILESKPSLPLAMDLSPVTLKTLILRYSAFAVLAVLANLATQRGVLSLGDPNRLYLPALILGTGVGLVVKYMLDKRWIFSDLSRGLQAHSRKFSLYTATGVITTAVFWGIETAFWLIWQTDLMREVGALLGLAIGYAVKYPLDRRYVFTDQHLSGPV